MNYLLSGQSAIVTGAAQGIGMGIAKSLISHGAKVVLIDNQDEKVRETALKLNGIPITADLTDKNNCKVKILEGIKLLGGLDIFINNAAPNRDKTNIDKLKPNDWQRHSQLVIEAIPSIIETIEPFLKSGASIVNISSVIGKSVGMDQCSWPYHVTKAGLDALTRWLACKFGCKGIRVNGIAPAIIDRQEGKKISGSKVNKTIIEEIIPLGRAGTSKEIGDVVAFLSSPMASYITGQTLIVDGGLGLREVLGASLKAVNSFH